MFGCLSIRPPLGYEPFKLSLIWRNLPPFWTKRNALLLDPTLDQLQRKETGLPTFADGLAIDAHESQVSWVSYQSSGGTDTPKMFSGFSKAIPHSRGRSGSTYTTFALALLSVSTTSILIFISMRSGTLEEMNAP